MYFRNDDLGASKAAQQIKLWLSRLASSIDVSLAAHPIKLLRNVTENIMEGGPNTWGSAPTWKIQMKLLSSCFGLDHPYSLQPLRKRMSRWKILLLSLKHFPVYACM